MQFRNCLISGNGVWHICAIIISSRILLQIKVLALYANFRKTLQTYRSDALIPVQAGVKCINRNCKNFYSFNYFSCICIIFIFPILIDNHQDSSQFLPQVRYPPSPTYFELSHYLSLRKISHSIHILQLFQVSCTWYPKRSTFLQPSNQFFSSSVSLDSISQQSYWIFR